MSEDSPPPSKNPFIRFKKHVDSRISDGVSFITGRSSTASTTDQSLALQQHQQQQQPPPTGGGGSSNSSTINTTTTTNAASDDMSFGGPQCGGPPFRGGPFGGGPFGPVRFWNEWSQVSPYSPYNLRHLRQPVPSDLPAGVDAKSFGFEDAFEDLMAVSAGRPLMDLSKQARMKKEIVDYFGFQEPPLNWVHRMAHDGLLPRPGRPRRPFGPWWSDRDDYPRQGQPASARQWVEDREARDEDPFGRLVKATDKLMAEVLGPSVDESSIAREWETFKKEVGNDPAAFSKKMFERAAAAAEDSARKLEKAAAAEHRQAQQEQQQPSTETDLFDMVWSTVHQADKTFSNFAKSFTDTFRPLDDKPAVTAAAAAASDALPNGDQIARNDKSTLVTTDTDESGAKTIRSESTWTDATGHLHVEVEVKSLDAQGRLVSLDSRSQTIPPRNQTTPGEGFSASATASTSVSHSEEQSPSNPGGKPSTGWFWR